jgi:ATP-dependent protease Clp ATPase subunit
LLVFLGVLYLKEKNRENILKVLENNSIYISKIRMKRYIIVIDEIDKKKRLSDKIY